MVRVTLGGDLAGFTSLGFDDHVKLFFPEGTGRRGRRAADGIAATTRPAVTTPRRKTLEIEFVLHDAGPATRWASQVQPGHSLRIGGPRGSFIIPDQFRLASADRRTIPHCRRSRGGWRSFRQALAPWSWSRWTVLAMRLPSRAPPTWR